ncbi:MAG: GNAT family N-acetyltransferase [Tannerella sp.]|jgi:RimJ/RimL family protein N-acetyltransferase|nr:GNAT family N-acetyltransferase [Tannerella sp.]
MNIRKANIEDIDVIMDVFDAAGQFMHQTGNDKQWIDGYPSKELILKNIQDESFYVCMSDNRQIVGVFYFKVEEDRTYAKIYDGEWLNDRPYGVVHRIASNGKQKGIADFCLQWCFERRSNIRVDTHRDNRIMQNALKKNGYKQCGIIYAANGTERIAFQKSL